MRRMALVRAASSAPPQQAVHERRGQLEGVDGQGLEVGEGGVAGAEVVDGQVDAEGAEAAEALQHGLLVGHEHALGDLQHQLARVQPGGVEGAGHVLEQVGLLELAHRQVDAEERVGLEREPALPVAGGLAGGVQHPAADGHDQAGVLGQGHELARHDQAPVGDTDAGPGQHLAAGHGDRGAQHGRQPFAQGDHLGLAADPGDEHGELVAAEAGRQVAGLQAAPQPLGHHPQDLVAGGVAEAVVDGLEVVQVQQEQGRCAGTDPLGGQRLPQPPGERGPVGQPVRGSTLARRASSAASSARSRATATWARRLSMAARASAGTGSSPARTSTPSAGGSSPSSRAVAAAATRRTASASAAASSADPASASTRSRPVARRCAARDCQATIAPPRPNRRHRPGGRPCQDLRQQERRL